MYKQALLFCRVWGLKCVIAGVVALGQARCVIAATPEQIQAAIDRGKAYLYKTQQAGNWEIVPAPDPKQTFGWQVENTQYGGLTAIATYALLASGEDPQDSRIKRAVEFLEKTGSSGTYALGLRCQIWNMVYPDEAVKKAMRRDRDLLIKGIAAKAPDTGFYSYDAGKPGEGTDHSTSQFGVLGLWALQRAGAEVPPAVWNAFDINWRAQQLRSGAWSYKFLPGTSTDPFFLPSLSMSAAGVATLFIVQDYTRVAPQLSGNIDDAAIDAGVKWMGDHLTELSDDRRYYTLFGISRVGLACGYKYIGTRDWFKWGADQIVQSQTPDGFWTGNRDNPNNVPDTAFSMLFLSRGRAPILINKLDYDVMQSPKVSVPGTWNQRPRDVANITRMIGTQIESQLNWQVVTLKQSSRDLHDAPILYMSGSTPPKLSTQDQQTLQEFIEDGGLVLGHADGSSFSFAEGFRKLGQTLFPGRHFRQLPLDHPIFVAENFPRASWGSKPVVEGLSNGDRELMLLLPSGDPAKTWQSQAFPPIKRDVFGQLMIDIVLYADDQQGLRQRDITYVLKRNEAIHANKKVKVARLQYNGNWDPEPSGWRRLAVAMHNDRAIDLDVQTVDPVAAGGIDKAFNAADLVVCDGVTLTDPATKAIHDYVEGGGLLVVDVAGGAGVDRSAAEAELSKIFPDAPRPLPQLEPTNPVYSAGTPIKVVDFRHYAKTMLGNSHSPRLRGWDRDGKMAIVFSPDDISSGLVGQQIGGILGYEPESAIRLIENVLTYAGNH